MEKKEWIDGCRRLFTRLLRAAVWPDFQFPSGGKADRQLSACFDLLCREAGSVSPERLSDFCICQVYALSGYAPSYRGKWNISHSFGRKAADRYLHYGKERRYWEDRWLKGFGRFIYPEYEEITKRRLLSSEAGYLVCALSTLMWTPFSPSCSKCTKADPCRRRTEARYPELYRIRCEAWWKEEVKP